VPALRRSWVIVGTIAVATLAWAVAGATAGVIAGAAGGVLGVLALRRAAAGGPADAAADGDLAGSWELLAVCDSAGSRCRRNAGSSPKVSAGAGSSGRLDHGPAEPTPGAGADTGDGVRAGH
jgi:hypothetical protein